MIPTSSLTPPAAATPHGPRVPGSTGGGASASLRRNSSGRCHTLIPGIAGASGRGGSHGVHPVHRDPCSALALQEVCGALHLPRDRTLHQARAAQEGCAGSSRRQTGASRQRWGPSGTFSHQKRPGGWIWKP